MEGQTRELASEETYHLIFFFLCYNELMDNGHTNSDDFEQSFMNSVNQAVGGVPPMQPGQPVQPEMQAMQEQPIQPVQPIQPTQPSPMNPGMVSSNTAGFVEQETKKPFPIFLITTIVCGVIVVILLVVLFVMGGKPSIASDSTENVRLGNSGNVEAIGAYCKMDHGTIYFDKGNRYFIEIDTIEDSLVEIDEGVYVQVETILERGSYTVDGYDLHLIVDDSDDYYAAYSHHELTMKDHIYKCENYD